MAAPTILTGDCLDVLATLPADSFQACVTSPPYFGLRDYGVEGQIGLEESPEAYVAKMVEVFRAVRRVLRPDGTLWLNLGDSYAGGGGGNYGEGKSVRSQGGQQVTNVRNRPSWLEATGLKPKDAMLMPERTLIALQADGWWVRDKIIWRKPNPMPSSVRDRFCPAWEPVFLLSRSARYFFDTDAAREPRVQDEDANGFRGGSYVEGEPGPRQARGNKRVKVPGGWMVGPGAHGTIHTEGRTAATYRDRSGNKDRNRYPAEVGDPRPGEIARSFPWEDSDGKRLMRNVWDIATEPFKGAHFATFPTALAERCIRIGTRKGDAVLDPFGGAGTVGLVASRLQRRATLIELNPAYADMARERCRADAPLLMAEGT